MDLAKMVRQTADDGYILVGDRADEFPTRNVYRSNIVLIKTDADGEEVWTRTYGDEILYLGWAVAQTPDGGYVLTGWEAKTIDDRDVIVLKTSETGDVEWSRTWDLVPGERDGGFDLLLTSDGYIVIACIQSMGSGAPSAVLVKVDLEGNEIWNKLIGAAGVGNTFWDIMEDGDGGYVMAGDTHLGKLPGTGGDIHGGLMIKTDADGGILWQRVFGEGQYDQVSFTSGVALPEGGYVFVGSVTPSGERFSDMLWLKLTTDATTVSPTTEGALPTSTNPPALGTISVDTVEQVELVNTLSGHTDRVVALAFSGDGVYLASYSWDKTIKLWEVSSGQETFTFGNQDHDLNSIAFSPDARLLASGETIWDVASKEVLFTLDRMEAGHPAFSPDGALLAVGGAGRPVRLWDVATGEVVRTFDSEADNLTFTTEFSPDGTLVVTSGHDGIIRLWDVESGHVVRTLSFGREVGVHDVAFSPDGSLLASGGTDEAVRLWDVISGETVRTLRNRDGLYGVAFSPDGTLVASAGCDRTVKVWEVASGSLLHTLRHPDEVMAVVFSPDGSLLASGGYDNEVYLWGIPR
jgi:WD40 repeat protein